MKLLTAPTSRTPIARTGTAEIELLLLIPLLLTILFIAGVMLTLGAARIHNPSEAERLAYQDATSANLPINASENPTPDPINDFAAAPGLPELPNRIHVATATTPLQITFGNFTMPAITLADQAIFSSPPLTCSGWPVTSDAGPEGEWMQKYAEFSIGAQDDPTSISGALDLAPSYPPGD